MPKGIGQGNTLQLTSPASSSSRAASSSPLPSPISLQKASTSIFDSTPATAKMMTWFSSGANSALDEQIDKATSSSLYGLPPHPAPCIPTGCVLTCLLLLQRGHCPQSRDLRCHSIQDRPAQRGHALAEAPYRQLQPQHPTECLECTRAVMPSFETSGADFSSSQIPASRMVARTPSPRSPPGSSWITWSRCSSPP